MTIPSARFLLICLMAPVLAGCVNLKPKPDAVRKYTLGPVEVSGSAEASALPERRTLYLMRPHLPGYLDSLELRYRSTDGAVLALPGARWAEPLEESLIRALAQEIGATGAVDVVAYFPGPQLLEVSPARLTLIVERLDALQNGAVHVSVGWMLRGVDGVVQRGVFETTELSWQVGEPASLVGAYNSALKALAESLTASLR